jgi:hypothetical protein
MQSPLPRPVHGETFRSAASWRRRLLGVIGVFASLALAVTGADTIPATSPDLHTFTNQDGRTIKAEISSVAEDYVFLKRDDGQSFKVPLSTLSKDDQNFIRLWFIKQEQADHDDILTLSESSVRSETPSAQGDPAKPKENDATHTMQTGQWSESYKVKVANDTPVHWANLRVRYIIFSFVGVPGALSPNDFTLAHAAGTVALDDLPGEQDKTVETNTINLREVTLAPGYYYKNGAPAKIADKLDGIWVRVYDENNNLLQEWSNPSDLMKDNNWDSLAGAAGRTRRGGGANRGAAPTPTN